MNDASVTDHAVQHRPRRDHPRSRGSRAESWLVFAICALVYGFIGYRVVAVQHVVSFESLDRLVRAFLVWHNDPPKLAAMGFDFSPLTTLALLPFTVFSSMSTNLVAVPVSSAVFGGLSAMALHRILGRSGLAAPMRLAVTLLWAANPLVLFYATNGVGDMVAVWLLILAVGMLVGWYTTVDTRYLIGSGLAFAVGTMADYGMIWPALVAALVIGRVLASHRAAYKEIEGSLVAFLSPLFYLLGLWILFNWLIVGDPFFWVDTQSGVAVNASTAEATPTSLGAVVDQLTSLVWASSPVTFIVLPALIVSALVKHKGEGAGEAGSRNELSGWLAVLLIVLIAIPGIDALARNDASQLALREGLPILVLTVIGAAWLAVSMRGARNLVALGLALALAVSLPITWQALDRYPYQSMEQAFHRAISTGEDQEGTTSRGGLEVGLASERAMAGYITANVEGSRSILTDNSKTFGVIALTSDPKVYFDRVDQGDGVWQRVARRPTKQVRYLLIARGSSGDQLNQIYPAAAEGGSAGLQVAYATKRYTLLRVTGSPAAASPATSNDQATTTTPAP